MKTSRMQLSNTLLVLLLVGTLFVSQCLATVEVEWARLKAHELRKLANENAVVILPIASIEQHGPHLPVMTDTREGEAFAHRAARIAYDTRPTVVTPVVWSGLSEHHMKFGGTLILSHDTFRRVLKDLIDAIVRHGFKDILISNNHGGNRIAMQQILDELAPFSKATLVATSGSSEAGPAISEILEDQDGIRHACEGETSVMMALEPDLVDVSNLSDIASRVEPLSKRPKGVSVGKASYKWMPFSSKTHNGVAGNPARSTAEKGEKLLEAGAMALAKLIMDPETWAAPDDLRAEETGGVPFRQKASS